MQFTRKMMGGMVMTKQMEDSNNKLTVKDIIEYASEQTEFFYSETDGRHIKAMKEIGGKQQAVFYNIKSSDFDDWFRELSYDRFERIASPADCNLARSHFFMVAKKKGKKISLHRRVVKKGNSIYYDLGWGDNRALKITPTEVKIVKLAEPKFLSGDSMAPQIEPDLSVDPKKLRELIDKHFNLLEKSDLILLPLFLVSCLWGDEIAHPLLQVYGTQGSAKSTSLRRIQELIDPHLYDLYEMKEDADKVALELWSDYMCCFDNVSYIPPKISDLLCRNCTGGAQKRRKLFTDTEQVVLKLKSVVCLNGVGQNITQPDLAERTLFIELEKIPHDNKREESQLMKEWNGDLPDFFGALCNLAKEVLNTTYKIKLKSPIRMTDFYHIAVKAGILLGYREKDVYEALKMNVERVKKELAGGSVLVSTIVAFMADKQRHPIRRKEYSVTEFYGELKSFALEQCQIDVRYFPKSPTWFSRKLNPNREILEAMGIQYEIKNSTDGNFNSISLWRI